MDSGRQMDHCIAAFDDGSPLGVGTDVSDGPRPCLAAAPEPPDQRQRFMPGRAHGTDGVATDETVGAG